ncbi:unnamed protein product, partial [marine sediment metagenome]
DAPHEHDWAVANICSMSPYTGSYFPLNQDYYTRYASLEGLTEKEISKLKYVIEYVLKKLYIKNEGKMLILKSPFYYVLEIKKMIWEYSFKHGDVSVVRIPHILSSQVHHRLISHELMDP